MLITSVRHCDLVQRYLVVEYPASARSSLGFDASGSFKNHLPVYHLMTSHHWTPLDSIHVLVTGSFPRHHLPLLEARQDVSLLPSVLSNRPIKAAMKKPAHWTALQLRHDLADDAVVGDVVDSFALAHGPVFTAAL